MRERPEESFEGSVKGRLEAINLHDDKNTFRIYPVAGPSRVTCHFPEDLRDQAVAAVDRNVIVYGELKYKANAPFPDEIEVEKIEILPPDEDLPALMELRGVAKGAIGDRSVLEYLRQVRNEWE